MLDDDRAVATLPALSGAQNARAELATLNRQLELANEDVAVAQQPISRLQRIIADADLSQSDLELARSRERDVLAAWISSDMQGPRPQPGKPLLECERRVVETAQDAAAARPMMADREAAVQRASAHRNTLVQRQVELRKAAILEAVSEFIAGPYADALWSFRACEDQVAAIESHYRTAGDFQTAEQIRALAQKQHRQLPPSGGGNARAGGQIVQRLLENPAGKTVMPMSPEEKLVLRTALGVPMRTFLNTIALEDLPAGLVEKAAQQLGSPPAACRILYNAIRSGPLHLGVVCVDDLSPDRRSHLELMAREALKHDKAIVAICKTLEAAEAIDHGAFVNVSAALEAPKIDSFEDPTPEMDQIFADSALANIERMLTRENPTLPASEVAKLAVDLVTSPDFFRRTDPT